MRPLTPQRGFTLVELVIVIAITGIIAVVGAVMIQGTVGGYVDQERRAGLVDNADRALRRMGREIRQALPNSLRLSQCQGGNPCVEYLATAAGGRYREGPGPGTASPAHRLEFNKSDTEFNSTGPAGLSNGNYPLHVSVYNTGQQDNDAWAGESMNPSAGITVGDVSGVPEKRITMDVGHQFPLESPRQRFFLVEGPVAFACEGGELVRYDGHGISDSYTAGNRRLLAADVAGCNFQYATGSSTRAGLLTMRLTLEDEGEEIRLLHQIHVDNAP